MNNVHESVYQLSHPSDTNEGGYHRRAGQSSTAGSWVRAPGVLCVTQGGVVGPESISEFP